MQNSNAPRSDKPISSARVVERNIEALLQHRRTVELQRNWQTRTADAITRFAGSMKSVYLHAVVYGLWLVINFGWTPIPPFDRSLVKLAMVASVEAIFLSTFVLISQNRMQAEADRRADLDLQISLLTEHELTRLISLVSAVGEHVGIDPTRDPDIAELRKDVRPEQVIEKIEEKEGTL